MSRFDLSEAEWRIIEPLLPGADGQRMGRPRLEGLSEIPCMSGRLNDTVTPWPE